MKDSEQTTKQNNDKEAGMERPVGNFTMVSNDFLDNLPSFTSSESIILLWMFRRSYGMDFEQDEREDEFALSYLEKHTGLSRHTVIKSIKSLLAKKQIKELADTGIRGTAKYTINWKVSRNIKIEKKSYAEIKKEREKPTTSAKNALVTSAKNALDLVQNLHPLEEQRNNNIIEKNIEGKSPPKNAKLKKEKGKKVPSNHIHLSDVVHMEQAEYDKLVKKFGKEQVDEQIYAITLRVKSKGDKYQCFYATVLNWFRMDKARNKKPISFAEIKAEKAKKHREYSENEYAKRKATLKQDLVVDFLNQCVEIIPYGGLNKSIEYSEPAFIQIFEAELSKYLAPIASIGRMIR